MSGLTRMNQRLRYRGGDAESRLREDKLRSLKKSLLYSYQSETITLKDGREFRCLINPNKNTDDYDDKIISIPFKDICLNKPFFEEKTSQGLEHIGLKPGDVFTWTKNKSKWLVYLKYLEEDAYFRAKIRRCTRKVNVGGIDYWIAVLNTNSNNIEDKTSVKVHTAWDNPNGNISILITKDTNTSLNIHRYTKLKIFEEKTGIKKPWKVTNINQDFGDNVIQVFLQEDYENKLINDELERVTKNELRKNNTPTIVGKLKVAPFSKNFYEIDNLDSGD